MRMCLFAVGKLKKGPETELYLRYEKRINSIGKSLAIGPLALNEFNESRAQTADLRRAEETQKLISKLPDGSHNIVLDESGKNLTSELFARYMENVRDRGVTDLIFTIGGPDGHGSELWSSCDLRLSLSPMTLTHGFARIIISEQIYRALTILSGHPYHRK